MKSQKQNQISKNMKSPKKKKKSQRKKENKTFSELNQCQCQTKSVLDNVSVRQCQDLVNVRLR